MNVIDELERLEKAATSGEWVKESCVRYAINSGERHVAMVNDMRQSRGDETENEANADLIVAMKRYLLAMLRLAKAAEEVADGLTVEYESCGGDIPEFAADRMYFMLRDTLKELGVKV